MPPNLANLCLNSSFEVDTSGWTAFHSTLAQSTAFAYDGTHSLAVTATAADFSAEYAATLTGATNGRAFHIQAAVNIPAASPLVGKTLQVMVREAGGAQATFDHLTNSTLVSGTQVLVADGIVVQPDRTSVHAVFYVTGGAASGNVFYLDTVSITETTTPQYPPETLTTALAGQFGLVAIRYRFEWRTPSNLFLADITTAALVGTQATIHLDNTQAVARTCDLQFDATLLPAGFKLALALAAGVHVAVFAEVNVGGVWQRLQLGLFHLDFPIKTQYPNAYEVWAVKGADLNYHLAASAVATPYTVPAGTNYLTQIASLVTAAGITSNLPSVASVTPVDFTWAPKTTQLQIINDLLFGINYYPLWIDAFGRAGTRARTDPALEMPAIVYSTAAEPRMLVGPSTWQSSTAQLWNQVSVADDDPKRAQSQTTHTNADPLAPASTVNTGRTIFQALTGGTTPSTRCILDVTTQGAIADFELRDQNTKAVQRGVITQPDPRRGNREWYTLTLEAYEQVTLWRCVKWDLPLVPGGPMTHVVELAQSIVIT